MRFIVDAHLPRRLTYWLRERGHEAIHTLDLPKENETDDLDIINLSMRDGYTIISKDQDFYSYYILHQQPPKLFLLTTGNLSNQKLLNLFDLHLGELLNENAVLELSLDSITVHY